MNNVKREMEYYKIGQVEPIPEPAPDNPEGLF